MNSPARDKPPDYVFWITSHYIKAWGGQPNTKRHNNGPIRNVAPDFSILEFPPEGTRKVWIYATCGMADITKSESIELHLRTYHKHSSHIETLAAIAHYHLTGEPVGVHHTVNLGRPWLPDSLCTHGYVSLPYLNGPSLEYGEFQCKPVRFLWLIPITENELKYKKLNGAEALELLFEKPGFDYNDPMRPSVTTVQ